MTFSRRGFLSLIPAAYLARFMRSPRTAPPSGPIAFDAHNSSTKSAWNHTLNADGVLFVGVPTDCRVTYNGKPMTLLQHNNQGRLFYAMSGAGTVAIDTCPPCERGISVSYTGCLAPESKSFEIKKGRHARP